MNRPSRLLIPNSLSRTPTHPTRSFSLLCPIPFPFLSPPSLFSSSSSLYFPLSHSSDLTSLSLSIATAFPAKFSTMENPPGPQPDRYPNQSQPEDFVHIEDPDPVLSESFIDVEVEEEGEAEAVPRDGGGTDGGTENDSDQSQRSGVSVESEFQLPEEISRSVMTLTCPSSTEGGTCHVYLVGTAHVSQESCREVEAVVSYVKPEAVFLELCASRVAVLTPQNLKIPTVGEMVEMWKKNHNTFGILYSYFLAKVANKLEVFPGSEFRVAYEEAMKYGGRVVLGDRPVQITLRRTWSMMPLWHKMKLVYSLLFQAFFLPSTEDLNKMLKEMDDVDMLTLVIQQMSKEFPTLMETLVHERDQYMSSTLLRLASERKTVVAVVGKGHLQGIRNHWQQPVVMRDLLEVPSTKQSVSILKILTSAGAVVAGVAIISGIYYGCRK